ncbi:MAG: tRNA pseudouridine(55) synthase TruB [Chitinivibrionales bacterium]|nr:tRNA pseudouridine(55) synthase TruB [Chitinivibrionales bacterium]
MNGFICVDKPRGPTSYGIVARIKRQLKIRRAGHCGTLDPNATGLLIIAIGKATRLIPWLKLEPKMYEFDITFGSETDTLDSEGPVIKTGGRIPEKSEIDSVVPFFTGTIPQVPPRYSAIKIRGTRAYKLAREGKEFTPPERSIEISSLSLKSFSSTVGKARLEVACSAGTYIRALARDIAAKLGTAGYASHVRRTALGGYTLEKAINPDKCTIENVGSIISIKEMFSHCPTTTVTAAQKKALFNGRDLTLPVTINDNNPVLALNGEGMFIALLSRQARNRFHPEMILN